MWRLCLLWGHHVRCVLLLCTLPLVWRFCNHANITHSVCSAVLVKTRRVVVGKIFLADFPLYLSCLPGTRHFIMPQLRRPLVLETTVQKPSTCDCNNSACYRCQPRVLTEYWNAGSALTATIPNTAQQMVQCIAGKMLCIVASYSLRLSSFLDP